MFQEDTGLKDGNEGRLQAELKNFINDYPALPWRIEISRSRIEFLNSFTVDALGDQTTLFMKNSAFRKTLLVAEDQPLLDAFFDAVHERKAASTIFRIQPSSGSIVWLKLSGTACSADANLYHGFLLEVTDTVELAHKIKEEELTRVALTEPKKNVAPSKCDVSEVKSVLSLNIQDATSIQNIMQSATAVPGFERVAQGIIFSDIHIRKNKVVVYFSGSMFDGIEQGEKHSFKGTVAEEIIRSNREYIVVDDTYDSIKPIDWALFIPRGVRSYCAKPFYVRGVLRTVLILCSDTPNTFSDKTEEYFDELFASLADVVKIWRRNVRK